MRKDAFDYRLNSRSRVDSTESPRINKGKLKSRSKTKDWKSGNEKKEDVKVVRFGMTTIQ